MTDAAELLASLRDIQEPVAPETANPAILIGALLCIVALLMLVVFRWLQRRNAWIYESISVIEQCRSHSPPDALARVAGMLRQIMRRYHGARINQLQGDEWLATLDAHFRTRWFSTGAGRVFGNDLYRSPGSTNHANPASTFYEELLALIKRQRFARHQVVLH